MRDFKYVNFYTVMPFLYKPLWQCWLNMMAKRNVFYTFVFVINTSCQFCNEFDCFFQNFEYSEMSSLSLPYIHL